MRDDTGVFPPAFARRRKAKKSLSSLFRAEAGEALLAMMLSSGGDERIAQGADGRNPYGAPIRPTDGEIWFASSTASAISQRGWRAAEAARRTPLPPSGPKTGSRRIEAKAAGGLRARRRGGRPLRVGNPGRICGAGLRAGS